MKKLLLAVSLLLSFAVHAEQPCGARGNASLNKEPNYDSALPGSTAPARQAPVRNTAPAKGTRG